MHFNIITIFPEIFAALKYGITGRAQKNKLIDVKCWNLRDFSDNNYRRVDERPYGGGPGMVMMYAPLKKAIDTIKNETSKPTKVIHLTPQGIKLDQDHIKSFASNPDYQNLILIAGRYEGIDERLIEECVEEEWSIGDYILSGGEIAAMVVIDAITRLIPGALGDEESANQDSFSNNLLDYPHYTRPEIIDGKQVPEALLCGNHKEIARWRLKQSLVRTKQRRPDLLSKHPLTKKEEELLH